jgi:plastocyanin
MSRLIVHRWAVLAIAIASAGCGGGDSDSPTTPTGPSPGGAASSVTISIVATSGTQSYNPNPAVQTQGATVAWRNSDGVVHRIVANDGSFDTGDIAPGATSRALTVAATGVNYHCSLHPAMIGAIGSAQGDPPPPCSGQYC